jgi:hypothetical protein
MALHTTLRTTPLFHAPSSSSSRAIISPGVTHKVFINASTFKGLSLVIEPKKELGRRRCCSSSRAKVSMAANAEKGVVKKEVFESEEDLAVSLAKYTAQLSDKFGKERGAFSVVLSGGSLINSLR